MKIDAKRAAIFGLTSLCLILGGAGGVIIGRVGATG